MAQAAKNPRAVEGDNSRQAGGIAGERLRSIVERVERLEEEKRALASDIKDIYAEAKSAGFDVTVLRRIVRERRKERGEIEEQDMLRDTYQRALDLAAADL